MKTNHFLSVDTAYGLTAIPRSRVWLINSIMSSSTSSPPSPLHDELLSRSTASAAGESFLYAFIVVVGTVGNFAVLLVLYKNHRLRNIPAYFVISLAMSDIIMLDLCAPFSIAVLMMGRWLFGDILCQIQGFVVMLVACASLGTLALVAINRWEKNTFHFVEWYSKINKNITGI